MSGGRFDYLQYRIAEIADAIEQEILDNDKKPEKEWEHSNNFSRETLDEFYNGVNLLRLAQVYAQRIDWLLSGDDGEKTFHERLKEDLQNLK